MNMVGQARTDWVGRLRDRKDGKAGRPKPHKRDGFLNAGSVLGMVEAQLSSHLEDTNRGGVEWERLPSLFLLSGRVVVTRSGTLLDKDVTKHSALRSWQRPCRGGGYTMDGEEERERLYGT